MLIISVSNVALGYALALCLQSRGIAPAWPETLLARLRMLGAADRAGEGGKTADPRRVGGSVATAPLATGSQAVVSVESSETAVSPAAEKPSAFSPLPGVSNIVQLKFSAAATAKDSAR